METKRFAVLGATGQVGRSLVDALLKDGHRVTAIGRNPEKLAAAQARGAHVVSARFDDVEALAAAFTGAAGVFTMFAPAVDVADVGAHQDQAGETIAAAVLKAGVTKVVSLSSLGAEHAEGTGPVKGLHRQEERLNALPGVDVIHLRAGDFMQNAYMSIPVIKQHGIVASALRPDVLLWKVSTADIGVKAAQLLAPLAFGGKSTFELVGPRPLSMLESTRILGHAIGKPGLPYVQLSYEDQEKGMVGFGLSPHVAGVFIEVQRAINDGLIGPLTGPPGAAHRGATTFEQFALEFAQAFNA